MSGDRQKHLAGPYSIPSPDGRGTITAESCTIVILGATGDLSRRKLLPALYRIIQQGLIPAPVHIVGAAGSELTHDAFRDRVREALNEFVEADDLHGETVREIVERVFYESVKFDDRASFDRLAGLLGELRNQRRARAHDLLPRHAAVVLRTHRRTSRGVRSGGGGYRGVAADRH
ncbi:MAG: hypothetical protein M5R36_22225 [Deltaproteobacteria bacterium]|nr:hypothetical protein [Deltaproteobacteria bacterium]